MIVCGGVLKLQPLKSLNKTKFFRPNGVAKNVAQKKTMPAKPHKH